MASDSQVRSHAAPIFVGSLGTGATFKELSSGQLKEVPISFPSLEEQRRIVAILDKAFESIAIVRANAEKNLQNARELFGSELAEIFRNGPAGTFGSVAEIFDGPHATPKTVDSGPIFLGISPLNDGVVDLSKTRHVTRNDFVQWTRRVRPEAGDVAFSYETRLGQAALIPEGLECCLGRRAFSWMQTTSKKIVQQEIY